MRRPSRRAKAFSASIPSPVGGWNTRDSLDQMAPTDAVVLDNLIPVEGKVSMRRGYAEHSTGLGSSNVDTLAEFEAGTVSKLTACANGNIYDATTSAASSLASGFTSNQWQTTQFNGRLFFVNGTDAPQDYDGTTASATAWSGIGLTITGLVDVNSFKNRLYFTEANSQDFWYGGVNSITGTLTKFPLSRVGNFGGNLLCMKTWTLDSGSGVDDLAVFIMTSGDVIVYQGSDPGDASNWSLVGVYRIGRPIDRRSAIKIGPDLFIATHDDYVSLSQVLRTGQIGQSSKLSGAIRDASALSGTFGWQSVLFRNDSLLINNLPNSSGGYDQHVVNTTTGGACRLRGLPSRSWATYQNNLYFGSTDGKVYQYTGTTDNGSVIVGDASQAWNDFGVAQTKRVSQARPVYTSGLGNSVEFGVGADFDTASSLSMLVETEGVSAAWDTSPWDTTPWPSTQSISDWDVIFSLGQSLAPRIRVNSLSDFSWLRTDLRIERGRNL